MTATLNRRAVRSRRPRAARWLLFDLHGRLGMGVDAGAPTAPQMADMFAPFRTDALSRVDLTVTADADELVLAAHAETEFRYNASGLYMTEASVQIERHGEGFRVSGSRELLTTVLPLVDSVMVRRGAAMIHAATFSYRGSGIAMPAAGGTGKTSTMAKFLRLDDAAFMGDDWAFASGGGRLLGYAKPMFIKPHHKAIYPHLFEGIRKPLVPPVLSGPVARFTTLVHPVVTQYPRLAGLSRRWSPEHRMVSPSQAFPDATIATEAPLKLAVFVERYDGPESVMEERKTGWMVSRLIGNFHAEVTRHSQEVMTALGAAGLLALEETFGLKADVLRSALDGLPCLLLQVPRQWSADRASDSIVEHLVGAAEAAGIGRP